ncbi:hypothetical protein GUJ93_ZPchr0006g46428 [Zizania palustris]|uniref:Uncharacterized protein n=1 Tax=Zizania palustris TaxID=103762 RepID=A0A8J5W526_ZIZPA|nr:hypothetical protein GUJ93_ZPchr0006g46428 [Zizania palustris]
MGDSLRRPPKKKKIVKGLKRLSSPRSSASNSKGESSSGEAGTEPDNSLSNLGTSWSDLLASGGTNDGGVPASMNLPQPPPESGLEVSESDDEADSEGVSEKATRQTKVRPPMDPGCARTCVPLLVPFLENDQNFAAKTAPLHDSYLSLRDTELISELGRVDGTGLSLAIESTASQIEE